MIYKIKKGQHRSWPLIFGLHFGRSMTRFVKFTESCRYDIGQDQNDVNKLFGFGFIPGFHHEDSARFGWNYNPQTDKIRLYAYTYVNGLSSYDQNLICEVDFNKQVKLTLTYIGGYKFTVDDLNYVVGPVFHDKKLKYKLGVYFGGNQRAPHNIEIKINK